MLALLKVIFYIPLYNGLVFLVGILPGGSVGAAVISLTVFIKLLLFPLSQKSAKFQFEMRTHDGEIRRIKERYKNDKHAQGKAILDFYREKGINPFAGILPILIQIPIVIALYYVFFKGGLPAVDTALLYPFVPIPSVSMHFLGIDIGGKSAVFAILVALTQFLQGHLAMPPLPPRTSSPSFQDDLARGMQLQMKYFLPVFMGFVSYAVSGAVALYFITSNLFMVAQEVYLRRQFKKASHFHNANTAN